MPSSADTTTHPDAPENTASFVSPADMQEHAQAAAALLKALANANRLQILCALGTEALSVSELNRRISLSQSALSQHLAKLRMDDLVETRRDGQNIFYRTKPGIALSLIKILQNHFCASP